VYLFSSSHPTWLPSLIAVVRRLRWAIAKSQPAAALGVAFAVGEAKTTEKARKNVLSAPYFRAQLKQIQRVA
jgi:hypothetical protein